MSFHYRLNQFECDHCRILVPRSQPLLFKKGNHFCSPKCLFDWQDKDEESRRLEEEREFIASIGED